jgi:transcriptional regulator with XRE-family HTH domain
MSTPPTPTVWRLWLASELRQLREGAGRTLDEVAELLECSRAKVSRIELAQVSVHPREVEAMLTFYGVDPEKRNQLVKQAREARRKGWWHEYRDLDQDLGLKQVAFIDNETAAASIRVYQALVIFGLLQTEQYARTVFRALRLHRSDKEIDRQVELRMKRQLLLDRAESPDLWVVLDEATLRRPIGGRHVMNGQLQHLSALADHPKIRLQVLPYQAGEHAGLDGSFTILDFAGAVQKTTIHMENSLSDQYLREPDAVNLYIELFEAICAKAYSLEETKEAIERVRKEL